MKLQQKILNLMYNNMDEYYDLQKEYIKHLENLASYDPDGRSHAASREWIRQYKEAESWNNMGGG